MQPDNFRPIIHSELKSEFELHPNMYIAELGTRYGVDYVATKNILVLSTLDAMHLFCYLNQKLHIPMWIKDKDYYNNNEGTVSKGLILRTIDSDKQPDYQKLLQTYQKLVGSNYSDLLGFFVIEPDKMYEAGLHSEDESIYAGIWINQHEVSLSKAEEASVENSINSLLEMQKRQELKDYKLQLQKEADRKAFDIIGTIRQMSAEQKKHVLNELIK